MGMMRRPAKAATSKGGEVSQPPLSDAALIGV